MSKLHFEDFVAGHVAEYGPRPITREEIVAFAAEFDPQPMHLDEAAGRVTMLGGLAASGWHTCCVMMRIMADGFLLNSSSMGSPGIDEVCWLVPVRAGDALTLRTTVKEVRSSRSRPDMGLVRFLFELLNQNGETVLTANPTIMFARRQQAAATA